MSSQSTRTAGLFREPYDFSLVLGGPLFQFFLRTRLCGSALELLRRRVLVICLLAWAPLLALSVWEGNAWGGTVRVPFLWDVHAQARFLVALPLLIVAELVVHRRLRLTVGEFIARDLVPNAARAQFEAAVAGALRLRASVLAEVLLLALVYVVGVPFIWRARTALTVGTWYAISADGGSQPTLAGWWLMAVSLPLFQFILLRWYFRLFIWMRFLWQVSRIDLQLVPTHPDQAGGLGFLANGILAFALLLFGQGALLAGWMAGRIFFEGATLLQFKVDLAVAVILLLLFVLGPLLVFAPQLMRAKRAGLREYGSLASRYVREFDQKWLRGGNTCPDEPLVGSSDIQSLADLGNSFDRVRAMRLVPFGMDTLITVVLITLLPVFPLTLTMIPLEELLQRLLKVLL